MSLRFRYPLVPAKTKSVISLGGRSVRPRPVIPVTLVGPLNSQLMNGLLDTGADDTVFPEQLAQVVGVDLSQVPSVTATGVNRAAIRVRYAQVSLRIAHLKEHREWTAWVAFAPISSKYALLGFAGFLQFFSALFLGDREEVELTVNSLYSGT